MSDHPFQASGFAAAARAVGAFEAGRRQRAAADAAEIRLLADAAAAVARPVDATPEQARRAELDRRVLVTDLATATRTSEWTVTRLLTESADLCTRFAAGVDALEAGSISRQHLGVIHDLGVGIEDDEVRAEFVRIAVDRAATLTPGRLGTALKVIAERFLEHSLEERRAAAAARRDVRVVDQADGLATLLLTHDATLVHGIHDRLTAQARSVVAARTSDPARASDIAGGGLDDGGDDAGDGAGDDPDTAASGGGAGNDAASDEPADTRTMDHLRADIAADLLLTAGPNDCVAGEGLGAIRATVQVTVPVLAMTGASGEPCLLAGYGPIDPETARTLAAGATGWERVMTSPVTGAVMCVDRYRPGPALDRFLAARDEHCRFPGCRQAVWRCDIDHTVGAARGGATSHDNLAHLCRRHHVLKTIEAWTVQQVSPGVLVWTSPTGRKHTDRPEPVIRFIPEDEILRRRRIMREPWLFDPEEPCGIDEPPGTGERIDTGGPPRTGAPPF